jgi:hypothetical protein
MIFCSHRAALGFYSTSAISGRLGSRPTLRKMASNSSGVHSIGVSLSSADFKRESKSKLSSFGRVSVRDYNIVIDRIQRYI